MGRDYRDLRRDAGPSSSGRDGGSQQQRDHIRIGSGHYQDNNSYHHRTGSSSRSRDRSRDRIGTSANNGHESPDTRGSQSRRYPDRDSYGTDQERISKGSSRYETYHGSRTSSRDERKSKYDHPERSSAAIKVCGDWEEHRSSSSSNKSYYYNRYSGKSQWDRPKEWSREHERRVDSGGGGAGGSRDRPSGGGRGSPSSAAGRGHHHYSSSSKYYHTSSSHNDRGSRRPKSDSSPSPTRSDRSRDSELNDRLPKRHAAEQDNHHGSSSHHRLHHNDAHHSRHRETRAGSFNSPHGRDGDDLNHSSNHYSNSYANHNHDAESGTSSKRKRDHREHSPLAPLPSATESRAGHYQQPQQTANNSKNNGTNHPSIGGNTTTTNTVSKPPNNTTEESKTSPTMLSLTNDQWEQLLDRFDPKFAERIQNLPEEDRQRTIREALKITQKYQQGLGSTVPKGSPVKTQSSLNTNNNHSQKQKNNNSPGANQSTNRKYSLERLKYHQSKDGIKQELDSTLAANHSSSTHHSQHHLHSSITTKLNSLNHSQRSPSIDSDESSTAALSPEPDPPPPTSNAASHSSSTNTVTNNRTLNTQMSAPAPSLTPSLTAYFDNSLISHVTGWQADQMETQANKYAEDAHNLGSINVTRVSAELKMARSLVRLTEIQATLQEQRIMFIRDEINRVENWTSQHQQPNS